MKNILKVFCTFIIFCLIQNIVSAFDIKKYSPFKKKPPEERPKMVQTKQEWEMESQNIPLNQRTIEKKENKIDEKKYYIPEQNYIFELYNYPQGKRELDISDIKKNLYSYPYLIADNNCKHVAYSRYYFSPDVNQISSEIYIGELDSSQSKKDRILNYKHIQENRIPIIKAGILEKYPNLFRGLTVVDWNKNGNKLLVKEKVGSTINGIYKTYLYVHFMPTDIQSAKTIQLKQLDKAIKYYFLNWEKKQIIKYRYDIEPLGFSLENDDVVLCILYVYDKNNNKIFLGTWGYNTENGDVLLVSKKQTLPQTSINGIVLKRTIN